MAPSRSVAVVDYGMGNLRSVAQALEKAAEGEVVRVIVTSDPAEVAAAERVVLPGQGAMRDCMAALAGSGLEHAVREAAKRKPLLGICVGMQMLLDHSEEQDTPGLGLIAGRVLRFRLADRLQPDGSRCKVPQMGWNRVWQAPASAEGDAHPLWRGIADGEWFYFVHSYHAVPDEPRRGVSATDYGHRFTSAIARDNIFATQFHPEKSASQGLALYRNFLRWKP